MRNATRLTCLVAAALALGSIAAAPLSPSLSRAETRGQTMPAHTPPAAATVSRRNPPTLWDSKENGHSQINIAEGGRLAFVSGQVALRRNGGEMPRDLGEQSKIVADNLAIVLEDLKASPRDIVTLRMYVVAATNDRFVEAWSPIKQRLGGDLPGLTGIGVQALWTPEVQLEVEMVVRVP